MIGWLSLEARRGWRIREEELRLEGLRIWKVTVPLPEGLGPRGERRRLDRAARALRAAGCRRVVTEPHVSVWPVLEAAGLRRVDPGPLCRALADPLACAFLEVRGVPRQSAAVALLAERVDRSYFEAACTLCPQVRHLAIQAGQEGEALSHWLEREYGVPALAHGKGAHVKLRFSPLSGPPGPNELVLCGPVPELGPLTICSPQPLPPELDPLPLLALLWEEGRAVLQDIEIIPKSFEQMT